MDLVACAFFFLSHGFCLAGTFMDYVQLLQNFTENLTVPLLLSFPLSRPRHPWKRRRTFPGLRTWYEEYVSLSRMAESKLIFRFSHG